MYIPTNTYKKKYAHTHTPTNIKTQICKQTSKHTQRNVPTNIYTINKHVHKCINIHTNKPNNRHKQTGPTGPTVLGLTLGSGTRASSARLWQSLTCLNWKGLFLLSSNARMILSLIHSTCNHALLQVHLSIIPRLGSMVRH